jgi:hypothetical protein
VGDDELVEAPESETSLIRKAKSKMDQWKLFERLIPPVVAAVLGVSGGVASSKVKGAEHEAVVQMSRAEIEKLKADIQMIREGFAQRVDVEENEREDALKRLERRLTWLEAKLDITAPSAAEAAAPHN